MSLDPAASPWPGVIASVAVCLWIAAIGALIAYAVFRDRPRLVWPFYAPIVGVAVVLLITNLAAYVIPGAPSAWFGLVFPSAVALIAARRSGPLRPLPPGSRSVLLVFGLLAVGVFALAYANRMHSTPDATWHYAVAFRLARGEFPPLTPFGVDAGIGYHYGANLLGASIVNVAGVFPWTALDALGAVLVVALVLAAVGFAYDGGAPFPLALGIGAAVGFFGGGTYLGYQSGYVENLAFLEPSVGVDPGFEWAQLLQRTVAVNSVVLIAAALHAGASGRHAAMLAAGAGVLALGDASVTIFACAAVGLVGVVRFVRLRGRERLVLAGALVTSALLVTLAGGPISDAIFERGGTAGAVSVAWQPVPGEFHPFRQAGPALLKIGIIPLVAIGAVAAFLRRSWGLGFLAAAGALGLLETSVLQSQYSFHFGRIVWLAHAVAMIGALAGIGALVGALQGSNRRIVAAAAVGLLVLLPTGLPGAVGGVHLALHDLEIVDPALDDSGHHYVDRTRFGKQLRANWEFWAWLQRSLPT